MKLNWNLKLSSNKLCLVPYRKEFVLKYHEWMQDPYLLEMTASEALSLEEEYEMQRIWYEDEKKCTFIITKNFDNDNTKEELSLKRVDLDEKKIINLYCNYMVGDVNLFFNDNTNNKKCEIEIMIAKEEDRCNGYGKEAVLMMMQFGIITLKVEIFYCKIHEDNKASRKLFQALGYEEINYVKAFQEYEYEYNTFNKNKEPIKNDSNIFDVDNNYINSINNSIKNHNNNVSTNNEKSNNNKNNNITIEPPSFEMSNFI